jgi:hypothetical protein
MPVKATRKSATEVINSRARAAANKSIKRKSKTPKPGTPKKKRDTIVMFQSDADNQFYWYALGRDGSSVAIGGEGYVKRAGVKRNRLVKLALANGFTFEDVGKKAIPVPTLEKLQFRGTLRSIVAAPPAIEGVGRADPIQPPPASPALPQQPTQQFGSTPVNPIQSIGSSRIDTGGNAVQGSVGDEHNPDASKP